MAAISIHTHLNAKEHSFPHFDVDALCYADDRHMLCITSLSSHAYPRWLVTIQVGLWGCFLHNSVQTSSSDHNGPWLCHDATPPPTGVTSIRRPNVRVVSHMQPNQSVMRVAFSHCIGICSRRTPHFHLPPPPPRPNMGLSKHGEPVFPHYWVSFGAIVFAAPIQ